MAIYSNENITKIVKLSHQEFPHLVQNRENICTSVREIYGVNVCLCVVVFFTVVQTWTHHSVYIYVG